MKKLKEFREQLWENDPHCERCGVLTIPPELVPGAYFYNGTLIIKRVPPNMATIQHVYNKTHPLRKSKPQPGERRLLLWCHRCNNEFNEKYENKNK